MDRSRRIHRYFAIATIHLVEQCPKLGRCKLATAHTGDRLTASSIVFVVILLAPAVPCSPLKSRLPRCSITNVLRTTGSLSPFPMLLAIWERERMQGGSAYWLWQSISPPS